jgi:hypothetical protein
MRRSLLLGLSILVSLGLAAAMLFSALGLMNGIYDYRSPISKTPPPAGEPLGSAATRRLVFVLIDGMRLDTSLKQDVMPELNELRKLGASATMHSQPPSFSQAGYSMLLTGAWPYLSDGPALNLDTDQIPLFTQDDVFSAIHKQGFHTALSGYVWFKMLVPQEMVDDSNYTPDDDATADANIIRAALPWLEEGRDQFILIHLDQVDFAGHHEGGPMNSAWDAAARRVDSLLAEIVSKLDLTQDTIIVCSDHGHIDEGGHGGSDPMALIEPFVMAGAGVKPGAYPDMYMVDVAPTITALFGANLPASTQGHVLVDMLDLPTDALAHLAALERQQQTLLVNAYAKAIDQPVPQGSQENAAHADEFQKILVGLRDARVLKERMLRAIPVGILLAVAYVFFFRRGGLRWWNFLLAAIGYFVIVTIGYAIFTYGQFSLSALSGMMEMIVGSAVIAVAGFLPVWLFSMIAYRKSVVTGLDKALHTQGLVWSCILLLLVPFGLHVTLNGIGVKWNLPELSTAFIGIFAISQMLMVGVVGALLTGISALIGALRKRA